jgi:hypothetical protein
MEVECLGVPPWRPRPDPPLRLKCRLVPRLYVWLDRGSGLLADEFASPWCYLLLNNGKPSMGLRLFPSGTSLASLDGEADFRPQRHRLWGNRRCGMCGRSVLHPWCFRVESEQCPRAAPYGGREVEASFPARCHEELFNGILDICPPWGGCPTVN